jgi:Ca-activated chloride channel family protein
VAGRLTHIAPVSLVGVIKRRAEAWQIYEEALAAGQTAALLEQERPNIFAQSVGNIDPSQVSRPGTLVLIEAGNSLS